MLKSQFAEMLINKVKHEAPTLNREMCVILYVSFQRSFSFFQVRPQIFRQFADLTTTYFQKEDETKRCAGFEEVFNLVVRQISLGCFSKARAKSGQN